MNYHARSTTHQICRFFCNTSALDPIYFQLLVTNVFCSDVSPYTNSKVIAVPVSEHPYLRVVYCPSAMPLHNGRVIKLMTCPVVCEIRITAVSHKVSGEVPNFSALALIEATPCQHPLTSSRHAWPFSRPMAPLSRCMSAVETGSACGHLPCRSDRRFSPSELSVCEGLPKTRSNL